MSPCVARFPAKASAPTNTDGLKGPEYFPQAETCYVAVLTFSPSAVLVDFLCTQCRYCVVSKDTDRIETLC